MSRARTAALFANVGRPVVALTRQGRELYSILARTLLAIGRRRVRAREVVRQAYLVGNKSLFFITVTLGFLGLISVYQVGYQVQQILPEYSMMGAAFIQLMVREFAPTICGLMIATRVGSGIAAEIGSMVVTEQVDALRMCNADPVEYLVVPRTLASTLMLPMLSIYGVLVATVAGMVLGNAVYGINPSTFLSLRMTTLSDVALGMTKAVAYGLSIPIVAGQAGLAASGGSAGVGWATTRAVVNASLTVVLLDFLISGLGHALFGL
ncbi:MAG: ABC transporter permease [Deltaproteobacteria bacterium]|nr:MAG: ABC transporter permease [Deltaproteobacteria bacterium]